MAERRVFLHRYSDTEAPELPDDVLAVCDIAGIIWIRVEDGFVHIDRLGIDRLPQKMSWTDLLAVRGPVHEVLPHAPAPLAITAA